MLLESAPADLSTEALVDLLGAYQEQLRRYRETIERLELELLRRMEADGARSVPHPRYNVALNQGVPSLDLSRVRPLLENETLIAYGIERVYTPEHQELVTVPERWSLRDLQVAARQLGGDVRKLIEEATMRGPSKLKVTKKE